MIQQLELEGRWKSGRNRQQLQEEEEGGGTMMNGTHSEEVQQVLTVLAAVTQATAHSVSTYQSNGASSVKNSVASATSKTTNSANAHIAAAELAQRMKSIDPVSKSARIAAELLPRRFAAEARLFGYNVLIHLIRQRWNLFTAEEKVHLGKLAICALYEVANVDSSKGEPLLVSTSSIDECNMEFGKKHTFDTNSNDFKSTNNGNKNITLSNANTGETNGSLFLDDTEPWAMKAKAASMCAEVIRAEGPPALIALLPEIIKIAKLGALQGGLVCLVLKMLAEEVMLFNEGLEADKLRSLYSALTNSLSTILPCIYGIMEMNVSAAQKAQATGNAFEFDMYMNSVEVALNAATAYAEWSPMIAIHETGLIAAAGFLIQSETLKTAACEFMMQVASRKRATDDQSFDLGIRGVVDSLLSININCLVYEKGRIPDDTLVEFMKRLAETINAVFLNHNHLSGPLEDTSRENLGQILLVLSEHPDMHVAGTAVQGWCYLIRAAVSQKSLMIFPNRFIDPLLRIMSERVARPETIEEYEIRTGYLSPTDSAAEFREMYGSFRSRFLELGKLIGKHSPSCLLSCLRHVVSLLEQARASNMSNDIAYTIDGSALLVESVLSGVPEESLSEEAIKNSDSIQNLIGYILSFQCPNPTASTFVLHVARCVESLSRLLQNFPSLLITGVSKMMDMIVSVHVPGLTRKFPPLRLDGTVREVIHHRQRIALLMRKLATRDPRALIPHIEAIAKRVEQLLSQDLIQNSEYAMMCEMLVKIATAESQERQLSILKWIFEPIGIRWSKPEFLDANSGLPSFLAFFGPIVANDSQLVIGGGEQRWESFCDIQIVESCLRAIPVPPTVSKDNHDNIPHFLNWMMPALLGFAACIHEAWTPSGQSILGSASAATEPCVGEREVLLGKSTLDAIAAKEAVAGSIEDDTISVSTHTVGSLRGWLRALRDAVYANLAHVLTRSYNVYAVTGMGPAFASSLFSSIVSMESRHLRMIVRLVLTNAVRSTPMEYRREFLFPVLGAALPHIHYRLSEAWANQILKIVGSASGNDVNEMAKFDSEILNARSLVELARDYCTFLQDLLDVNQVVKLQKGLEPIKFNNQDKSNNGLSCGMLPMLLEECEVLGLSIIQFVRHCFRSPDNETVYRCSFCARAVIAFATKDARLNEEVGREMFVNILFALGSDKNSNLQADLFSIMRDILWYFGSSGIPYEVFQSIPGVTPDAIISLQQQLQKKRSEKDQRSILKQFVIAASGDSLRSLSQAPSSQEKSLVKLSSKALYGRKLTSATEDEEASALLPPLF